MRRHINVIASQSGAHSRDPLARNDGERPRARPHPAAVV